MLKTISNCHDWSDWVSLVTKTRPNNDVIDQTNAIYVEKETELPLLIGLGVV